VLCLLTEFRRQHSHFRLRRRPRTQRERIRQSLILLLHQLRSLRARMGTRRTEIRSKRSPLHRNRRLERRHDRHRFLPQLRTTGRVSSAAWVPGSRSLPSPDLLTLNDLSAQESRKTSRRPLRSHRHLWSFRRPHRLWDPADGRKTRS
jgi:hypothetical protein